MRLVLFILFFLIPLLSFSQFKDTVYIKFNEKHNEMEKIDFTDKIKARSPDENLEKSIDYKIRQMEIETYGDTNFSFIHFNQNKKAYQVFGGEPPKILKKPKSFLDKENVLDINFFRTTPFIEIAKTFEEENSWEEDRMIFIIDVDEIRNDSIILRQVSFGRPVKE